MLIVVHFGTEQETAAWASGKFELVCRAFSRQTDAARQITSEAARRTLAATFVTLCPGATAQQAARLFGWTTTDALSAFERAQKSPIAKAAGE